MLINRQLGEFVLLRRLAVGGQSEVFLAMKEGPDEFTRPVVIKALPSRYRTDPKFVDLFYREAFLSARFSHPNVITVHDARVLRGEHCMIMDFISGQTVADMAQRGYQNGEPPTINQAVRIVADACDGLSYTHDFRDLDDERYSVVHRDVSPQNLMVTYQGVAKVFDFGIAKIQEEDEGVDTLVGGKYAYMSPEQCLEEEVDHRSDIFSLGIILYELATGFRLFRRPSREEVIEAITEEEIRPPMALKKDFPQFLENVIMKALERDPDQRFQTAAHMRNELLQYLAMKSDGKVQHRLGEYVSGLFEDEREDIAKTVRKAVEHELDPEPIGEIPLEELGHEDSRVDSSSELEVPMPEPTEDEELAEQLAAEEELDDGDERSVDHSDEAPDGDALDEGQIETEDAGDDVDADTDVDGSDDPATSDLIDRAVVDEARERNERLAGEVRRLQRRQNLLVVLLLAMSIVAVGVGAWSYLDSQSQQREEPIQIGSP